VEEVPRVRDEETVLGQLVAWGDAVDNVRAAVLTSSRANPSREVDWLSDYDVELFVKDLGPFLADDRWLDAFGRILVRWPLRPGETDFQEGWITRLVLFEDHVRIDFQITDRQAIPPHAYRDGYRVLIDKDGLLRDLPRPTHDAYRIRCPTREEFLDRVNAFWWDAAYVPKHLWRDELPFTAQMAAELRQGKLRPMMEWWIGSECDWTATTGLGGRWFKRFLDEKTWSAYEATFATAGIEDQWRAFFALVELFSRLAREVATRLGYPYPAEVEEKAVAYFREIQRAAVPSGGTAVGRVLSAEGQDRDSAVAS
jgi:aminoglycoside 6-adenylyltransferase